MHPFAFRFKDSFALIMALIAFESVAFAATNAWVPSTSGDWHVAANWSLGTLPDSSQSVLLDAPGWKAIAITPVTAANFPASLTVQNLTIRNNSTQDVNTLLLNYAGTAIPLRVLNGLSLQDAARIVNFNSGLVVDGGGFVVTNAEIIQDGGLVRATNGGLALRRAAYYLTNGLFQTDVTSLNGISTFNQYGGSATMRDMYFCCGPGGGGSYSLSGGNLTVQNLDMDFDNNGASSFLQTGGTNRAQSLLIRSGLYGLSGSYTLSNGFLQTSNTVLMSGPGRATFQQDGGIHRCTQTLMMEGTLWHGESPRPANYFLTAGQLFASALQVRSLGALIQNDGYTSVSGDFQLIGNDSFGRSASSLAAGTLACSNLLSSGAGADFVQTGGVLFVTNLFTFGGSPTCCSTSNVPNFSFSGGTITASNIQVGDVSGGTYIDPASQGKIGGRFLIGSSATSGRITNPGYFSLGGTLGLGDVNEQLGRFIVGGPSIIDFGSGNARIGFASSSAEIWHTNTVKIINWAGSTNGGGSDQLKFGNNASGLSPSQLQQIVFSNPVGLPAGDYPARMLSTGEVVPGTGTSLSVTHSGIDLVLNWPIGWTLQSATNVTGPYLDIPSATAPYTNQVAGAPQKFFRLRH